MRAPPLVWLALGALLWWPRCDAALNLLQTRLIYDGGAREVSLMVHNQGAAPSLLQAWVDGGNEQQGPADVTTPFLILPPMIRLGPDKGQALRVLGADLRTLPQDRESLFWLNVLGLPPKASGPAGTVQLAYRTRIKLLYRPVGLKGSLAEAIPLLVWQRQAGVGLSVTNPTPFHVSLSEVWVEAGARKASWQQGGLIPPYGMLKIPIQVAETTANQGKVRWIDDDGLYHEQGFVLGKQGGNTGD